MLAQVAQHRSVTGTRVTDQPGGTGTRIRQPGDGARRCSRRPCAITARRAAAGTDSRRLDDLGVGPDPEGSPGDVDTGRRTAGFGSRQRTDCEADTETQCAAATVA